MRRRKQPVTATERARARHARGVEMLLELFGPLARKAAAGPSRSWMNALDHRTRQMVRAAKAQADPTYPARRRKRKAQRVARRASR